MILGVFQYGGPYNQFKNHRSRPAECAGTTRSSTDQGPICAGRNISRPHKRLVYSTRTAVNVILGMVFEAL